MDNVAAWVVGIVVAVAIVVAGWFVVFQDRADDIKKQCFSEPISDAVQDGKCKKYFEQLGQ